VSKQFTASALIYLTANVANAAIPFLLMPVLTRVLTPADYGLVAMFTLFVTLAGAFTGLSMHGAVAVRFFQRDEQQFARYLGACLRILVIATAAALVVIAVGAPWFESLTQLPRSWLFAAILVASANVVISIRLSLWQMRQQAAKFGAFQVGQGLLNMGLSLVFVLALGMAWQGRALAQLFVSVGFMLLAFWWLRGGQVARPQGSHDTRDILKFGVPLIPHVAGSLAIGLADRFMIANMLDVAQAGLYTVALQIGMGMGLLTESFNRVYAPWLMAALSRPDAARDLRIVRGTYSYFLIVTVLALALGLIAPWLLGIIVGPAFQAAAPLILYIAMGFAFGGMYYMVTNYVFYASRTARLAMVTLAAGACNVALTWCLIKRNGAIGAAQAFMISQALLFVGTWWLARGSHRMPWLKALAPGRARAGMEAAE
jgi:O-antigen/teichoic acid export membrane protein